MPMICMGSRFGFSSTRLSRDDDSQNVAAMLRHHPGSHLRIHATSTVSSGAWGSRRNPTLDRVWQCGAEWLFCALTKHLKSELVCVVCVWRVESGVSEERRGRGGDKGERGEGLI